MLPRVHPLGAAGLQAPAEPQGLVISRWHHQAVLVASQVACCRGSRLPSTRPCAAALATWPPIRRYARKAWRWVGAYIKGLDGELAALAVRKSKCHRFVTQEVDRRVNEMKEEQDRATQAREKARGISAGDPPMVLGVLADLVAVGALGDGDEE